MNIQTTNVYTADKEQALWNCAVSCSLKRQKRDCPYEFDSSECSSCAIYIKNYGNFSPADARLYMLQAYGYANELRREGNKIYWVLAAVVAVVALLAGAYNYSLHIQEQNRRQHREQLQQQRTAPTDTRPAQTQQHTNIVWTLMQVADEMRAGRDVNRDGLTNCIDAALLFYWMYPENGRVQIWENKHPDGRMWHLYVRVFTDGRWAAVEPQARFMDHWSYWMRDIWGNQYNPQYSFYSPEWRRRYLPR